MSLPSRSLLLILSGRRSESECPRQLSWCPWIARLPLPGFLSNHECRLQETETRFGRVWHVICRPPQRSSPKLPCSDQQSSLANLTSSEEGCSDWSKGKGKGRCKDLTITPVSRRNTDTSKPTHGLLPSPVGRQSSVYFLSLTSS